MVRVPRLMEGEGDSSPHEAPLAWDGGLQRYGVREPRRC
jgi:hypothetical protein